MVVAVAAPAMSQTSSGVVRTVPELDLSRYAGRWYEIARLPNRFQNRCVAEVTAEYELVADGTIRVVNQCRDANGALVRAEGRARLDKREGPASRMRVRFAPAFLSFLSVVWGDYWVLDLTEDYGAALVGTPDRRYLWVLARDPELDPAVYERLLATARAQGFDLEPLVRAVP
jgi:apolipoprotein D and lipocalin family protein